MPTQSGPPALPPIPTIPPDTVVAEVDGKKYTAAQVDKLMDSFPPQMQNAIKSDLKRALNYVLTMHYLAAEAEKALEKLKIYLSRLPS